MDYDIVIGLEIHAELLTQSKMYCGCSSKFGSEPNTQCCPVCLGMPGTLPVLNKKAVEYAIKAGLAMNCAISSRIIQDRKNYFYPDLPKAYQISQNVLPLCKNGFIEIDTKGGRKRIGITRIHLEEDAGKLIHEAASEGTMIDFNRCGVPLIEIVSEPDISSPEEARVFTEAIKSILEYINVCDCKMQEGSLRADVNLSVKPTGSTVLGTRTEMKNLNSFRSIQRASENEAKRQINILEAGGSIRQETRRWNDSGGISTAMREKEDAHDYRYFFDPDIPPIIIEEGWLKQIKESLPELPDARKLRYIKDYGLPEYDAGLLTASRQLAEFFEEAAMKSSNPKAVSNWIMGDMIRIMKEKGIEADKIPFPGYDLAELVSLVDKGIVTGTSAKKVLELMFDTGGKPGHIVREKGLEPVKDEEIMKHAVRKVIDENRQTVEDYKNGKEKVLGYFIGQVMKEMNGRADPKRIVRLLKNEIGNLRKR